MLLMWRMHYFCNENSLSMAQSCYIGICYMEVDWFFHLNKQIICRMDDETWTRYTMSFPTNSFGSKRRRKKNLGQQSNCEIAFRTSDSREDTENHYICINAVRQNVRYAWNCFRRQKQMFCLWMVWKINRVEATSTMNKAENKRYFSFEYGATEGEKERKVPREQLMENDNNKNNIEDENLSGRQSLFCCCCCFYCYDIRVERHAHSNFLSVCPCSWQYLYTRTYNVVHVYSYFCHNSPIYQHIL